MTFKLPKTRFAPTEPKQISERKKPTEQQCLGELDYGKGRCQAILPYNNKKRLCSNCTKRNAGQSRSVTSQGGGKGNSSLSVAISPVAGVS